MPLQFVFNSISVDAVDQLPEPVRGFPSSGELASVFASDHFPVIVDLSLPLATPGGCNEADLAEAFGVLDLSDINAFTTAFVSQDDAGDLDANGIFDLADINLFVNAFVAGCP